jgi:two-component system KDP operon response regulator KdpE
MVAATSDTSRDTAGARVILLSDRWQTSSEWQRRGIMVSRPRSLAFGQLLEFPPDALVVDSTYCDARVVADCWQLRDLLHIRLVMVTDGATSREVVKLLERGADEVLTGGPASAEVAACTAAILRRVQSDSDRQLPAVVDLDGVEIDIRRRAIRRGRGLQSLSRTEFALLLTLIRRRGGVCTYRELIASAWGVDCSWATHYIRLHIRYLRQKIEDDAHRPRRILNVWGTGYRLALGPAAQPRELVAVGR